MNTTPRPVDEYVEAEVQRLLTEHADVAEQGLTAVRREHTLLLCGEVASRRRRDEVERLVRERFPDIALTVDIGVIRAGVPDDAEDLTR